jgi:predicted RNase H-like nuclease
MMLFANTSFIGIDPTAGKRPMAYAALDGDLRLVSLSQGDLEHILAFLAGQRQAVVAVCAPRRPSTGAMTRPEVRQGLTPPPRPGRWTKYRVVEYLLRRHRISTYQTPADEQQCPRWMKMGFTLYRRLEGLGFQPYPAGDSTHQYLEVYPHACYTALLGVAPFPKSSLEGRIQRQLVLNENRVLVPDPMRLFEEITRHRILRGILPDEQLYTPAGLDALVAAFTAWKAVTHRNEVTVLGHAEEGQVILPVAELKSHY